MTYSKSLNISIDGHKLVLFSIDRKIRIIDFRTGKIKRLYDESLSATQLSYPKQKYATFSLEPNDYGRRLVIERTIYNDTMLSKLPVLNSIFDETGNFLIYSTFLGIKCVNLNTNKVLRLVGKME